MESIMVHSEQFVEGVGRRKSASARVRISPRSQADESVMYVNERELGEYFDSSALQTTAYAPLRVAGSDNVFFVTVQVRGGGTTGHAEAIQLGLARALEAYDSELRRALKDNGYLSRDPRVKERKKPGLRKARKHPEWSKR